MSNYRYIQDICCLKRAKELYDSIPENKKWEEAVEIRKEQEYVLSFGANDGYVIYNYTSTKPNEIMEIIKGD